MGDLEDYTSKYLKYKMKYLKLYNENKHLLDQYQKGGTNKGDPELIAFTAKWCHHCKVFSSTWQELNNLSNLNVKLVNYDSELHKNEIDKYNIKGFPTIILKTKITVIIAIIFGIY